MGQTTAASGWAWVRDDYPLPMDDFPDRLAGAWCLTAGTNTGFQPVAPLVLRPALMTELLGGTPDGGGYCWAGWRDSQYGGAARLGARRVRVRYPGRLLRTACAR